MGFKNQKDPIISDNDGVRSLTVFFIALGAGGAIALIAEGVSAKFNKSIFDHPSTAHITALCLSVFLYAICEAISAYTKGNCIIGAVKDCCEGVTRKAN
jgi:hypothetical protein